MGVWGSWVGSGRMGEIRSLEPPSNCVFPSGKERNLEVAYYIIIDEQCKV